MDIKEILGKCDHTLLKQESRWEDIKTILDDAKKYHTASVCIPPCYIKRAREYAGDEVKLCTVIGFPNGSHTTKTKVFETKDAIEDGADEVDMVINIGELKTGNDEYVLDEIKQIRKASEGKILKVIIETCLLTEDEKIRMCDIVTRSGADYIKTSTGFSTGGATFEDIALFAEHVGKGIGIKASGGISSIEDAEKFIELGATRLGTSRIVKIVKEKGLA
ncbi:MAG: deoxyribose-phosphate aldolase [Lachnospiraceae bacterium]|nr:deoxyribose-phosphate aldolase [Lachnospiraceae bacterium]